MSHRDSPKVQGILKNEDVQAASPSSLLGFGISQSPKSTPKSVSIAPRAETISPLMLGKEKEVEDLDLDRLPSGPRQHRAKGPNSKRLSGRRSHNPSISSLHSIVESESGNFARDDDDEKSPEQEHHLFSGRLVGQITSWIREERSKRHSRKTKRTTQASGPESRPSDDTDGGDIQRRSSTSSIESVDLSKLEQIIKESLNLERITKRKNSVSFPRKRPSVKDLHRASSSRGAASSDTDYHDGDVLVPSAEAWLDNTKTLAYTGGNASESSENLTSTEKSKARDAWATFKYEIVRLTHTLRLKGWRRVPMEMSGEIEVERLSGALTNAVYVVSPPHNLPQQRPSTSGMEEAKITHRPAPPRLLLRIYGPQVEHLIDREAELQILRRLARKHIGPRLLGTFNNGRFEEFFHARALTPNELRNPDTSKQIAKRMRELHEGVDLLERERDEGAFVWRNWDKWQQRVENVVSWLDSQILQHSGGKVHTGADAWKNRGLVCGTEWAVFKQTLEKYRVWLEAQYGNASHLRQRYVFAHNDTQYGNILRLLPTDTSPLLLPANTHKQLIVIDFEYASANTPGLEFANHFTEWCYNYHDPATPWRLNSQAYPTPEDQDRFVRAYVRHRPQFNASTPKLAPLQLPDTPAAVVAPAAGSSSSTKRPQGPTQSISNFMLDARGAPPSSTHLDAADTETKRAEDADVAALLRESRIWRLANSAQWVAWGIVQAKVAGMPDFSPDTPSAGSGGTATPTTTTTAAATAAAEGETTPTRLEDGRGSDPLDEEAAALRLDLLSKRPDAAEEGDEAESEDAEFDYLAYARSRAMFFWGDALELGIVTEAELPEDVVASVMRVAY
ncbi:hypothetical protein MBLNU459_g0475t2 [Dothideomycetes sp. NU459]